MLSTLCCLGSQGFWKPKPSDFDQTKPKQTCSPWKMLFLCIAVANVLVLCSSPGDTITFFLTPWGSCCSCSWFLMCSHTAVPASCPVATKSAVISTVNPSAGRLCLLRSSSDLQALLCSSTWPLWLRQCSSPPATSRSCCSSQSNSEWCK